MRTNENLTKQAFVRNLGQLLSQTRTGVISAELKDEDTVIVHYQDGEGKVNIACDSYLAIIKDVVNSIGG